VNSDGDAEPHTSARRRERQAELRVDHGLRTALCLDRLADDRVTGGEHADLDAATFDG